MRIYLKRFESRRIISILKKEILHTITLGRTELVYMLRNAGESFRIKVSLIIRQSRKWGIGLPSSERSYAHRMFVKLNTVNL